MPGQVTRVTLKPDSAGEFDFLCDNFCGTGHEEMNGEIIVTN
jgi:cytochrome c oxidase subunit 2